MPMLRPFPQQLGHRRRHDREARQRHLPAERHRERNHTAEGMADEMDAPRGLADDGLNDGRLMRDAGVMRGAALGRPAVAEQARGHAAIPAVQAAITGRHTAPVLQDPGTSRIVGPAPVSS
jgi:hypothetical protein